MSFITDKQTLDDLNLLGRFRKDSIINIFDRTRTRRGRRILEDMFRNPLTCADEISGRSGMFRYFSGKGFVLPIDEDGAETAEFYLDARSSCNPVMSALKIISLKIRQMFAIGREYEKMLSSMSFLAGLIIDTQRLWKRLSAEDSPVRDEAKEISSAFNGKVLGYLARTKTPDMHAGAAIALDRMLGIRLHSHIRKMFDLLYRLDVYLSVSSVADENGYCYAGVRDSADSFIDIEGVRHPALKNAVPNDIRMDSKSNVFFLTGVNMAGKSTFMKTLSIALYLAQMGFPVPARKMDFTPMDGLFTSINVFDDISLGYSHFYAEVLRVKQLALEVKSGKRLFIVFDELFKGTNVKDAHDATLSVAEAFARHGNCLYIISTHIVEAGQALSERCANVRFSYFPAELEGDRPVYAYRLKKGISDDRHGMTIIRNEGILDIIRKGKQ